MEEIKKQAIELFELIKAQKEHPDDCICGNKGFAMDGAGFAHMCPMMLIKRPTELH